MIKGGEGWGRWVNVVCGWGRGGGPNRGMFKKNWGGVRGGNNRGGWGGDIMWVGGGLGEGVIMWEGGIMWVGAKPTNQQTNQQRGQKQNVPHYYRILLSSDNHLTDRPTDRPT
ncbi:hypothetical protein DPMN_161668 [Dreissena polymorpha]|uniref:Uncharacterized protein n=1 Tax=Dreissena polymorpha TaxID=45954 RepID=A0A9D4IRB2_DREPO|nr:hypothetical protein DPMN_161668 [Dreissena polymorpha]